MTPAIGVLALQGDFAAHLEALRRAGARGREIREAAELDRLDGLILPGGESTAHLKLMDAGGFPAAIRSMASRGGALFGTCAGAILLAREVTGPDQAGLGLIDISIRRNAYGRQTESFEASCAAPALGREPLELVFIRAPKITATGPGVEVLAALDGEPVLVRQGKVLAGTFHPELSADPRIHRLFLEMAGFPVLTAS